ASIFSLKKRRWPSLTAGILISWKIDSAPVRINLAMHSVICLKKTIKIERQATGKASGYCNLNSMPSEEERIQTIGHVEHGIQNTLISPASRWQTRSEAAV